MPDDGTTLDLFGHSVAISGDIAVVGAFANNNGLPGAAYLFDVTSGEQLFKLTADDGMPGDQFGCSVAIDGDLAIIGANRSDGVAGSAYLFAVATGGQIAKLSALDAALGDQFGYSVAIDGKTAVVGLLERNSEYHHSRVRTEVIPNTRRRSLSPIVRRNVVVGSEVFTDALRSYSDLGDAYIHQVIDHAEAYVEGHVHTNNIENFWSLLKRAIRGTYVNVEPFHLFRYLAEEAFRYNARKTNDGTRFQKVAGAVSGKRLTYRQLIGATTTPV